MFAITCNSCNAVYPAEDMLTFRYDDIDPEDGSISDMMIIECPVCHAMERY